MALSSLRRCLRWVQEKDLAKRFGLCYMRSGGSFSFFTHSLKLAEPSPHENRRLLASNWAYSYETPHSSHMARLMLRVAFGSAGTASMHPELFNRESSMPRWLRSLWLARPVLKEEPASKDQWYIWSDHAGDIAKHIAVALDQILVLRESQSLAPIRCLSCYRCTSVSFETLRLRASRFTTRQLAAGCSVVIQQGSSQP